MADPQGLALVTVLTTAIVMLVPQQVSWAMGISNAIVVPG